MWMVISSKITWQRWHPGWRLIELFHMFGGASDKSDWEQLVHVFFADLPTLTENLSFIPMFYSNSRRNVGLI
jgi:hypothetical protein